jgi:hypothetical protein
MASKRIRIDVIDDDGAKYGIKIEGNVNRAKVLKVFEMLDLMNIEDNNNLDASAVNPDSVGAQIWYIIDKYFPIGKFTSSAVLEKYEDEYNKPIKLSVISTYLSRFNNKGKVGRNKTGREWSYNLIKLDQKSRN